MTTTQADRATFTLRSAAPDDCEALVRLIGALAEYEKLTHLMQATPEALRAVLFGPRPYGEAVVAEVDGRAVGFALFFHNVSTFLCKPGLYLEDLFVEPAWRG
ncbi:N-acetyltransferase family protein, partial [Ralstonia pseudosolanacearum]